jgi:hypothetical protein
LFVNNLFVVISGYLINQLLKPSTKRRIENKM